MSRTAVIAAAALLLLLPLLSTPVLPLIDLYNHMARFYVLAHPHIAEFQGNYVPAWALLPNLGIDLIATPLVGIMPVLPAAKILVAFILLVQFTGALFFAHALRGRFEAGILPFLVILSYSFILNWGFINFLLGMGLMFWTLGAWVKWRHRPVLVTAVCSLGVTLTFVSHGFAFFLYGLLAGLIELGLWFAAPRRTIPSLLRRWALLAVQAVAPVGMFLAASTSGATGTSLVSNIERHVANGSFADRLTMEFWYRLKTVYRVAESPYFSFDIITFLLLLLIVGVALKKGWWRFDRRVLPAVLMLAVLTAIMPTNFFSAAYLADRLPLVLALICVAGLSIDRHRRSAITAAAMVAAIAVVRIGATAYGWAQYTSMTEQYERMIRRIPPGATIAEVRMRSEDRRDGLGERCQVYRALVVPFRHALTPLFAIPGQQPLRIEGRLGHVIGQVTDPPIAAPAYQPAYNAEMIRRLLLSGYDYAFVCGIEHLNVGLPGRMSPQGQAGNLALVKIEHAP